jgi:ligand-binding sensor domain-containing protein
MIDALHTIVLVGVLLSLLCLSSPLSAQTMADPRWRLLTAQDGMLSNDVQSVLVDNETIWLGTDRGIARYDGAWTNYPNVSDVDETATQFSGLPLEVSRC